MNVKIGTEAPIFLSWEYLFQIFGILSLQCGGVPYTVKKSFSIFPSPAGMSLTKLSLVRNYLYMTALFPPRESLVSDIPAVVDWNIENFFTV